jgi:hypothetical protein
MKHFGIAANREFQRIGSRSERGLCNAKVVNHATGKKITTTCENSSERTEIIPIKIRECSAFRVHLLEKRSFNGF